MVTRLGVDPRALDQLAAETRAHPSPATTEAAARQFEAVFADMMIKSMRAAHLGSDLAGRGGQLYTSLYDWQIAEDMTRGRGLGIARMLMHQLKGISPGKQPQATPVRALDAADRLAGNAAALRPAAVATAAPVLHALDAADRFAGPTAAMGTASAAPVQRAGSAQAPAPLPAAALPPASGVLGFVQRLWPEAQSIAQKLGVSVRAVIAQAALETGWGRHEAAAHNLFGIKATGAESGTEQSTLEYANGVAGQVITKFRRFPSDNAAMAGYATLISTDPRYAAVHGAGDNVRRFADALQRAGYATDPAYAEKLVAVANDPRLLAALDAIAGTIME